MTAAPLLLAGDAGELVTAMFSLGVPHPPGYPLFSLTGKAASLFPLGDVGFRGNILSAVTVSLTALVAYEVMRELSGREFPAVFSGISLAIAFCSPVWGIATESEVYAGSLFLELAALYLLLRWKNVGGDRYAYAAAFVAGLSVSGHYSALVILPGLMFFMLIERPGSTGLVMRTVSFGLLGLSTFLYVPIRAHTGPPINWGEADGLTTFLAHISRAAYGDIGASKIVGRLASESGGAGFQGTGMAVALLAIVVAAVLGYLVSKRRGLPYAAYCVAAVTLALLVKLSVTGFSAVKLGYTASLLSSQGWWPLLVPAVYGLYLLFVGNRKQSYAMALILLCMSVVYIYRVPDDPRDYMLPVAEKFFAPWFAFTGILAGTGIAMACDYAKDTGRGRVLRLAAGPVSAAIGVALLIYNYPGEDRSRVFWPHDYSVDMMRTFEQDAVFLAEGDYQPFFSIYQQVVEEARPDVKVLTVSGIIFDGYDRLESVLRMRPGSTVFCSQEGELNAFSGIKVEQTGVLNRWSINYGDAKDPVKYYVFRGDRDKVLDSGYMNRSIYANYYYHMGRRLVNMGRDEEAKRYLYEALRAGGIFTWVQMNIGNIEWYWGMEDKALSRYRKVIELAPAKYEAYLNMGSLYLQTGRLDEAEESYLKSLRYGGAEAEPYMQLAKIYEARGMREKAAGYWEEYLKRPGADTETGMARLRLLQQR